MKNLLFILTILVFAACSSTKETASATKEVTTTEVTAATGELDRSQPPTPGPAPEINIGDYQTFTLDNGLRVFVVENSKLPRVALSLQLDIDPELEGDKTGLGSVCGDLLSRGTDERTKSQLDSDVDYIGASFSTYATGMYGSSLTKHKEKLVEIMNDVLTSASFPEDELAKIKQQMKSGIQAGRKDPGQIATNIRMKVVYGEGHPYSEVNTEETIDAITVEDCKSYYQRNWSPRNAYLSIVGDISLEEAKKLATDAFGTWRGEEVEARDYKDPASPQQTTIVMVNRPESVQSEIRVSYPVEYSLNSEDYLTARLMNQILGGGFSSRLNQNLREDKAFTYGTGSALRADELIGYFIASASVRNAVTDSAVYEFLYELERMAEEGVTEDELNAAKAYLTGSFARSLESPQTISAFAIDIAEYGLPSDFYKTYLQRLNAITLDQVNATAKKYLKPENAYVIVVGKSSEVRASLEKFGPVIDMDIDGNLVEPALEMSVEEGVDANKVLEDYIVALGGKDKLTAFQSLTLEMEASVMGQTLTISQMYANPDKARVEVYMQGNLVTSVVTDGNDVLVSQMGNNQKLSGEEAVVEKMKMMLVPELAYADKGVKTELKGIENFGGVNAYEVLVTFPNGSEMSTFFDVNTGFKVREVSSTETPMGNITEIKEFSDYKPYEGVYLPTVMNTDAGMMQMEAKLTSVSFNEVPADSFRIE